VSDRKPTRPFPWFTLEESVALAIAIQDKNAGRPMNRLLLAEAIGRKPGSSEYRDLLSAGFKYGLTNGSEKSRDISLTALGVRVTRPTSPEDRASALREAALSPEALKKIYTHFDNAKFPTGTFFHATLERQFGIPREHTADCEALLQANGRFAGILRDSRGAVYVLGLDLGQPAAPPTAESPNSLEGPELEAELPLTQGQSPKPSGAGVSPLPRKIFVAHGKNKRPLEQLKAILTQFKVPYEVAVDAPHEGRPIGAKVAELMKSCTSGIFIFTDDEQTKDAKDNEVHRPTDNVVFELGAGTILYGNKIVIFREEGVSFGSDFTEYGHISFEKDKLDAKTLELLKELIGLGFLEVRPT
jgi:Predicted nucleotide-binding protein containing TIR-like domain